jgi:guanylate kinase
MSVAETAPQGLMIILSSPSGAGKTSIARELLRRHPTMRLSISATTRAPRPQEGDGTDYYFVSQERFESMAATGDLLEYATVFRHSYGTPRQPVEAALAAGHDVLFDIDWQGTQQLKITMRRHLASVFILPPSMTELHRRLVERQSDSPDVIAHRMTKAMAEISHWGEYDYVIVNRDIAASVAAIEAIITAEKLRRSRQPHMAGFVRALGDELDRLG